MSTKYLGDTIDIHGGGQDLEFPHHENEIAQSEAKTGKKFVNYWMHNGFVTVGKKQEKMSKFSTRFLVMAVMFTVCLITSNFFVPRLWQVGHTGFQLSGAVLLFPVSYILNDCLTEVYGYRKSRLVIWLAFALSAFVAVMSQIVCCLPAPAEESSRQVAEHFNSLFAMVPRTTIASLLAFICGSTCNAWIMSKMKVLNKGRYFGLRAILSSIGGELLDSLIFFPFVFWGIMDLQTILKLVFTQVVVKTSYELVILPATSWFVKYTKKKEGIDTYDESISYNPFKLRDL